MSTITHFKCNECNGTGLVDNYYSPIRHHAASDYGVAGMYIPQHREEPCQNCEGGYYAIEE